MAGITGVDAKVAKKNKKERKVNQEPDRKNVLSPSTGDRKTWTFAVAVVKMPGLPGISFRTNVCETNVSPKLQFRRPQNASSQLQTGNRKSLITFLQFLPSFAYPSRGY
jgi:hypothetical protein